MLKSPVITIDFAETIYSTIYYSIYNATLLREAIIKLSERVQESLERRGCTGKPLTPDDSQADAYAVEEPIAVYRLPRCKVAGARQLATRMRGTVGDPLRG